MLHSVRRWGGPRLECVREKRPNLRTQAFAVSVRDRIERPQGGATDP